MRIICAWNDRTAAKQYIYMKWLNKHFKMASMSNRYQVKTSHNHLLYIYTLQKNIYLRPMTWLSFKQKWKRLDDQTAVIPTLVFIVSGLVCVQWHTNSAEKKKDMHWKCALPLFHLSAFWISNYITYLLKNPFSSILWIK